MLEKPRLKYLTPDHPVRLTKVEGKVVQIEIYVNRKQRCQIFDYFPDKTLGWKETASHLLILKSLAAYQNQELTDPLKKSPDVQKKADDLAKLVKKLCHATAPLYSLVNRSYFDNLDSPLDKECLLFKNKNVELDNAQLKIAFLIEQVINYEGKLKEIFEEYFEQYPLNDEIKKFQAYQTQKIQNFIQKLEALKKSSLNQEQVQKIFSNQNQMDALSLPSLGKFLRAQAKTLMADAIASIDEITQARFEQLFSLTAHPLRKQFVYAKSDLEKQLSTHAVRFINSQSPIPKGQLDVIEGYDTTAESKEGWMNIMPYVTGKAFLGDGIGGHEGLNDVDQILSLYMHTNPPKRAENVAGSESAAKTDQNNQVLISLKKPHFRLYQMFIDRIKGRKGPRGILSAILLGLPLGILSAAILVVLTCIAMAVDLALFILQGAIIVLLSPLLVMGIVVDLVLQLFSFFSKKFEFNFSLLAEMALWNIPPPDLMEGFRNISLVRRLKQWILEEYDYCEVVLDSENEKQAVTRAVPNKDSKTKILNKVRHNQAEGFFNLVATKFFTFATIANFLHIKLKQVIGAIRELRKVFGRLFDLLRRGGSEKVLEKHRKKLIKNLKAEVEDCSQKIINDFKVAIEAMKMVKGQVVSSASHTSALTLPAATHGIQKNTKFHESKWAKITPWNARQFENPLDFISDIGLGLVHQLVDPAFENNPGIATPAFVGSIGCFAALLFPTVGNTVATQIISALQFAPASIAKAFMGKSLEAGLATIPTNVISVFLQWKLIYFGSEALTALYHGDIEWIKKVFENPEEITLSAGVFVAMGYGVGLIPNIPTDMWTSENSNNPFLQGIMHYLKGIASGFAHTFNAVAEESREVAHQAVSGPNSLELAFIGLKSSMLFYGLLSGNHQISTQPLEIDPESVVEKFSAEFKNAKDLSEKEAVIRRMLSAYNIPDKHSTLAKKITNEFRQIESAEKLVPKKEPSTDFVLGEGQGEGEGKSHDKTADSEYNEKSLFISGSAFSDARDELRELISLVHDMEILGMGVDIENYDDETTGYRSNADGELMYDALFFAIEKHNRLARKSGLFHEQIDGRNFLHNFYNKYCYTGSSGWHKILFGILLFPITWLWRGFKYLIGTPAVRQQVKKSFSKDFAMFFQLIPDVIAPVLRSLLKSILYAVRMCLGILVLPPLLIAAVGIVMSLALGLVLTPFAAIYAIIVSTQKEEETFVGTMQSYFNTVKKIKDGIWNRLLCNSAVNDYMKFISLVGSTSGTGSLHRLNLLKAMGAASLYERLTSIADTSFENLVESTDLILGELQGEGKPQSSQSSSTKIAQALRQLPPLNQKALAALTEYDDESETRRLGLQPRDFKRPGQLAAMSYQAVLSSEKPLQDRLKPVLNQLQAGSELREKMNSLGLMTSHTTTT